MVNNDSKVLFLLSLNLFSEALLHWGFIIKAFDGTQIGIIQKEKTFFAHHTKTHLKDS